MITLQIVSATAPSLAIPMIQVFQTVSHLQYISPFYPETAHDANYPKLDMFILLSSILTT